MKLNFAIIGNPNCGLTTLFNQLTGGQQHSGFFSTADNITKEGPVRQHKDLSVIELPGIYSLSDYSVDDVSTRRILLGSNRTKSGCPIDRPDVIINVIDCTSLERNLYLTLQLMELEMPMVIALNMIDEARANNINIDIHKLSEILTVPVIPISASKNEGIHDLIHYAREAAEQKTVPEKIDFCSGQIHTAIHSIAHLAEIPAAKANLPVRFCATKLVEGDKLVLNSLNLHDADLDIINGIIKDMEQHLGTDSPSAISDMRYAFIESLCRDTVQKPTSTTKEQQRTLKIDKILTHKFFAIPIFIAIMLLVFYLTFDSVGALLSDFFAMIIDKGIDLISSSLLNAGASETVHALVVDGICRGVGSVLSFLPLIAVLFFFLSILEDSGYMSRVAFVMDKLLRKLGLSGQSIVPMLIGFGCSVPAIMATRSLPSKRDRHLTMALIPFCSCSAKLPIYAMFTAAFFANHKALVLISIYVTGIVVAIICAKLFNATIFKGSPVPFVMVMPAYRMPAVKNVLLRMWENVYGFIKKAFTVVFAATVVIWFLQSFDFGLQLVTDSSDSILASIGKAIAPIFAPLGFGDWQAATALVTGLSAKEAVVSTLSVLTGSTAGGLSHMLSSIFSPLSAFAFLLFCLLYMPCIATLATVRREMGGWRYAFSLVIFQTVIAWIVAFITYNVGGIFV